ncbi:unnamed protein product [Lactuca virosa]|uniref:Uncharacterized protein n=1 Tax=Lactuca virosa TaxID=75947 RepID=A0AAU9NMY5_9ASTR|nr:unnamed protein product [Lactuca virosa]
MHFQLLTELLMWHWFIEPIISLMRASSDKGAEESATEEEERYEGYELQPEEMRIKLRCLQLGIKFWPPGRRDAEFGGSFHIGRGEHPKVKRQAGHPCFSILTRIGVFRGRENHIDYPVYRAR